MSGFAVHLARRGSPDAAAVERALQAAPHRGASLSAAVHGASCLGLVRHDSSDEGDLAISHDLAVVVAGVIDNLTDLRGQLREHPPSNSPSPASVLASAWRAFGERTPSLLRGAYAAAVSDGRHVWCFRDQIGFGTLFMRDQPDGFWAASEPKQVVAGAGVRRDPDLAVLETLFYGRADDTTPSALRGVTRLPKASVAQASAEGLRTWRYWDPAALLETGRLSPSELKPTFDQLMARAVERVLRGDDIVALSGGIDSPAVATFAASAYLARGSTRLPALSMLFGDYPSVDESPYIRDIARHLDLVLHTYQPSREGPTLEPLARWVAMADGPWMGWWEPGMDEDRYRRLAKLGLRNLLTGDFAEFAMAFPQHLIAHLLRHGRIRALTRTLVDRRRAGTSLRGLGMELAAAFAPRWVYPAYRRLRPRYQIPDWVDPARTIRVTSAERLAPAKRWLHYQLAGFLGPGLPFEAYQMFNEAHQVRVRWPWADVDLYEFFLRLPAEVKFSATQPKQLVRGFLRGRLPDTVLERRDKTVMDEFLRAGFDYASLRYWLRGDGYRMPGVDYAKLGVRLGQEGFGLAEYQWANDLAQVHAFVSLWEGQ
jgi:hypothetical protein